MAIAGKFQLKRSSDHTSGIGFHTENSYIDMQDEKVMARSQRRMKIEISEERLKKSGPNQ
jgi:hypothetical protein